MIESSTDNQNRRKRERLNISLPIRVQCRESKDYAWDEISRIIDVTPFGAGFILRSMTEGGRILFLTLPLPRQLRCYDHLDTQYRIWALVRHVKRLSDENGHSRYLVGVAFIGKHSPPGYEGNPSKRYEILKQDETGMWQLSELPEISADTNVQTKKEDADLRFATRHKIPLSVTIEILDDKGVTSASEMTVTENISSTGASIFTTLDAESGRFVRFTCDQYNVSLMAVVRSRRTIQNLTRLHLEFIDRQFPFEGIE